MFLECCSRSCSFCMAQRRTNIQKLQLRLQHSKLSSAVAQAGHSLDTFCPIRTPCDPPANWPNSRRHQQLTRSGRGGGVLAHGRRPSMTPLLQAIVNGDVAFVAQLLRDGVDVNAVTHDGWTPLMKACLWERVELVALLLDHGASAAAQTVDGWSALTIARHKGNDAIVRMLVRHMSS